MARVTTINASRGAQGDITTILVACTLGAAGFITSLAILVELLSTAGTVSAAMVVVSLMVFAGLMARAVNDRVKSTPTRYAVAPPQLSMAPARRAKPVRRRRRRRQPVRKAA